MDQYFDLNKFLLSLMGDLEIKGEDDTSYPEDNLEQNPYDGATVDKLSYHVEGSSTWVVGKNVSGDVVYARKLTKVMY